MKLVYKLYLFLYVILYTNYTMAQVDPIDDQQLSQTTKTTAVAPCQINVETLWEKAATCHGLHDGTGLVRVIGSDGWPYKFTWVATVGGGSWPHVDSNTFRHSRGVGLKAGMYQVQVEAKNGSCSKVTGWVWITEPTDIFLANSSFNHDTCGTGIGSAYVDATGGSNAPYNYSWSTTPPQYSQNATGLTEGYYNVEVTDSKGCKKIFSDTIETLQVDFGANDAEQCLKSGTTNNVFTFDASSIGVGGDTMNLGYQWDFGDGTSYGIGETVNHTYNAPGSYTVTLYTIQGKCTKPKQYVVTVYPNPTVTITSQTNVMCYGAQTGSATASAFGTGGYTYVWSNGSYGPSVSNLGTNGQPSYNYSVTVTDANGCTQRVAATITQPPSGLTTSISSFTPVMCFGNSTGLATVSANGGTPNYSYSWSNGYTSSGASASTNSGLVSGTYSVVITDANGCTSVRNAAITQPFSALTAASGGQLSVDCFGNNTGQSSVIAGGGTPSYTYSWSNGATNALNTGVSAGTYSVLVTDANGCTQTQSVTVTQSSAPLAASQLVVSHVMCYVDYNGVATVSTTGGTPTYSYSWSNGVTASGGTSHSVTNLPNGTFTVTITDARGCTDVKTVTLTEPPSINGVASVASQSHCQQSDGSVSVSVNGGSGGFTYSWNTIPSQTATTATGLAAGNYNVVATDVNGCTKSLSIGLSDVNSPAVTLSAGNPVTNVLCYGNATGSIDITVSGGTPSYTYSWNNGLTTEDVSGLTSGNYSVTITDGAGCVSSLNQQITQPQFVLNTVIDASTSITCYGFGNGNATVATNGGTPSYTYSWSNGQQSAFANNLTPGTYTATVTDANGCIGTETVTITQPSAPLDAATSVMSDVNCYGDASGSASVLVSGGTVNYTYSWSNGAITSSVSNLASGTYTVYVHDQRNCTTIATVTIAQPSNPLTSSVNAVVDVDCFGNSTGSATANSVGGTANYNYSWSNGSTNAGISNLIAGTYFVTITDSKGCTTSNNVQIAQPGAPMAASASYNAVVCHGDRTGTAEAFGSGGTPNYAYSWNNGQTTQIATNLSAGTYTVLVTDANGCSATTTVTVTQPTYALDAAFTPSPSTGTVPLTVAFNNTSTGATSYWWDFGDTTLASTTQHPSHVFDAVGQYTVTLIAYYGPNNECVDTAQSIVIDIHEPIVFDVPNVFTPNGDGVNDFFFIPATGLRDVHVEIYDRWGLKMYEWDGVKGHWDGRTIAGGMAPDATYYFIAKIIDVEDVEYEQHGFLQLIR